MLTRAGEITPGHYRNHTERGYLTPVVRGVLRVGEGSVVTLTVHGIGPAGHELAPGEERTWVDIGQFERVLDAAVGRSDVRITFDDGNASDLEIALPRLLERGLTAEFFVLAGLLGQPGRLDRDGVRELHRAGMRIGSHGWAHRDWRRLTPEQADEEMSKAHDVLGDIVGEPVTRVAIPFGSYDGRVLARLRRARVTRAYTSDGGRARPGSWLQARNSLRNDLDAGWISSVLDGTPTLRTRARRLAAGAAKRVRR
jgi:peptidoglycan/xylan/chitin deacetylase (PgdA/CDA1 family)